MTRPPRSPLPGRRRTAAPAHDRWLLSYADFVTLLLAVFIVLFATAWRSHASLPAVSSAIHSGFDALGVPSKPSTAVPPPEGRPQPKSSPQPAIPATLAAQLQTVLGGTASEQKILLQETPEGLVVSLPELGFFASGEATLLPEAAERLTRTAIVLARNGVRVRVEGHSDDQPIHTREFRSNWELSTARATGVLTVLLDAGFPPEQISVAGYGPYRPAAPNTTPEGRRRNRRVDLVLIPASQSTRG